MKLRLLQFAFAISLGLLFAGCADTTWKGGQNSLGGGGDGNVVWGGHAILVAYLPGTDQIRARIWEFVPGAPVSQRGNVLYQAMKNGEVESEREFAKADIIYAGFPDFPTATIAANGWTPPDFIFQPPSTATIAGTAFLYCRGIFAPPWAFAMDTLVFRKNGEWKTLARMRDFTTGNVAYLSAGGLVTNQTGGINGDFVVGNFLIQWNPTGTACTYRGFVDSQTFPTMTSPFSIDGYSATQFLNPF